ncbi:MAG TPA: M3 family oligoendopeptidase [Anaerolineaceae bacterium]|nr:M3 family oligoendopeptidase [Anaerolineaceae bacterium]
MKFTEIPYERPDVEKYEKETNSIFHEFEKADNFEAQWQSLLNFVEVRKAATGMITLATIRRTINTLDPFYEAEQNFIDENSPKFQEVNDRFYSLLLASPFLPQFEEKLGKQVLEVMRLAKKVFSPEIMEDLAEENKLSSQYNKLLGSAQVLFKGETYTLSGLTKFFEDPDRQTRTDAQEAYWGYFKENAEQFDQVYDQLVHLRDKMAKKLGYKNHIQMGYDRMSRTGYGPEEVRVFREGVKIYFVPLAAKIFEQQKERLGLKKLAYYDVPFTFASGNPKPQGDEAWMKVRAQEMYDALSPETSAFFRKMLDEELMDLSQKKGKEPGGYCTFIETVDMPFIFSNFNGTSGDVDVLTHEFGHSLQCYESRHLLLGEQMWPTAEGAEVHSMGMEYITYPWMPSFFGPDATKYHYSHQTSSVTFLPYGALVDEFQHFVYGNPDVSPAERKAEWRRLEKIYMPWLDYEDNAFLEMGSKWQRQSHIYGTPFYYIDYCLAQIVAQQIFLRSQQDREALWEDYLAICRAGGKYPFLEMLELGHFKNPFNEEVVGETLAGIQADIASIDTSSLK